MYQSRLMDILRSPSSLLAIIGLALITIGREAHRYPVLVNVGKVGFITFPVGDAVLQLSTLITFAVLLLTTILLATRSGRNLILGPAGAMVAAVIMAAGYLGKFEILGGESGMLVFRICAEFTQACGFFILISWACVLFKNERDRALILVAYSFLVSGILQALLGTFIPQVGVALCSFAPVISVLLMVLYRYSYDTHDKAWALATPLSTPAKGIQRPLRVFLRERSTIIVLICFFAYAIVCYSQSQTWLSAQDIHLAPLFIQLFGAMGTILAAVVLIVLLRKDFNVLNPLVYKILIFMVFALSAVISAFGLSNTMANIFTTFIDAGYKFILFFIWLFPILSNEKRHQATLFSGAHCVYQLGVIAAALVSFNATVEFICLVVCLVFLMVELGFSLMRTLSATRSADQSQKIKQLEEREAEARQAEAEAQTTLETYSRMLFMVYLSETFHLTQREFEVFPYFLKDMKSREIAEALYISQETVRTHRRNIYQKLGVNSREALQEKVRGLRENEFPTFLQTVAQSAKAAGEED